MQLDSGSKLFNAPALEFVQYFACHDIKFPGLGIDARGCLGGNPQELDQDIRGHRFGFIRSNRLSCSNAAQHIHFIPLSFLPNYRTVSCLHTTNEKSETIFLRVDLLARE
jgi:hypothetical protein